MEKMNQVRCIDCKRLKAKEETVLILTKRKNGELPELVKFYGFPKNAKSNPFGFGKYLWCEAKQRYLRRNWNIYKQRKCSDFSKIV